MLHVTVFAVTRLSRGEEGNFKRSLLVTLIYKIYLMYIEEKRTSLKISSLMGDFKDLCKKKQNLLLVFCMSRYIDVKIGEH